MQYYPISVLILIVSSDFCNLAIRLASLPAFILLPLVF